MPSWRAISCRPWMSICCRSLMYSLPPLTCSYLALVSASKLPTSSPVADGALDGAGACGGAGGDDGGLVLLGVSDVSLADGALLVLRLGSAGSGRCGLSHVAMPPE